MDSPFPNATGLTFQQVAKDADPATEKLARRSAGDANPASFKAVTQRYIDRETVHLRRGKEVAQTINRELMPVPRR